MNRVKENIDEFVVDLLHVNDVNKNKLIDINAGDLSKTYYLSHYRHMNISKYVLEIINKRIGRPANTVLRKSSIIEKDEQILGSDVYDLDWEDGNHLREPIMLRKYIDSVYSELFLKGNNPLFLSIGAVEWQVVVDDTQTKVVKSPLLLFPIRLVRHDEKNTPVQIEFINDEIYLNPCFLSKLRLMAGDKIVSEFPHPNGENVDVDAPVSLEKLGDGELYFEKVCAYVSAQNRVDLSSATKFSFDKNVVVISQYNHDELCMYYDIKRNKEKIYNHPLVQRLFNQNDAPQPSPTTNRVPMFIKPRDSVQEKIIRRVINGESLIIKGPPGTGKTLTITNMIASLLHENKKILLSSQKTEAMFEVYAKLPEELRKFTMLLDSETEAQAAKLSVSEVKKDFNDLIHERKKHTPSGSEIAMLEQEWKEKSSAAVELRKYNTSIFEEKDVIGGNYYDALDIYCKTDVEPVYFAEPEQASQITRENYADMYKNVISATEYFDKVSGNHGFIKSPWYPLSGSLNNVQLEDAMNDSEKLAGELTALLENAEKVLAPITERYKGLTLKEIEFLTKNRIALADIELIIEKDNAQVVEIVEKAYEAYTLEQPPKAKISIDLASLGETAKAVKDMEIDLSLTAQEFNSFIKNDSVLKLAKDLNKVETLNKIIQEINQIKEKISQAENEFYTVFRRDITDEDLRLIESSCEVFSKYAENGKTAPTVFDFKAKKLYEKIKTLGYGNEISFVEVVQTVLKLNEITLHNKAIEDKKVLISKLFQLKLEAEQISCLYAFILKCVQARITVPNYLAMLSKNREIIQTAMSFVSGAEIYTMGDLISAVKLALAKSFVNEAVERLCVKAGRLYSETEALSFASTVVCVGAIYKHKLLGETAKEISALSEKIFVDGYALKSLVEKIRKMLAEFESKYFASYYTNEYARVPMGDFEIYVSEVTDRSILNAVTEFIALTESDLNKLPLDNFFRPFVLGVRKATIPLKDIFEHSVYGLAIEAKLKKLGKWRNGLGDRVNMNLDNWAKCEKATDSIMLKIIENGCMSRINPADPAFAFLNAERGTSESLRKMFKTQAKEILKLKKCFILSSSTASVFLGDDAYSDFDIVIIDEASQLCPTAILPVLFRAKQVVMVGDEHQMPPIKHFKKLSSRQIMDESGETELLNPDMSVLSLALKNKAFPTEKFVCHYRSQTESLIKFSQERFYSYMRTFPSPEPRKDGLGFNDVYVEDGYCDGGVNTAEAQAVVQCIRQHFDRYYDEKTGVLSKSVGVVAFGLKQTNCIERLVEKDEELSKKIDKAVRAFGDVKEKLIFFRNIETVQGQETDHMILSLTYGKNSDGVIRAVFGELNRGASGDKLGQCIFNVAVTRARYMVSVVRSVWATDIDNPNVEFIAEYLKIVERFSEDGKAQFVGKTVKESSGYIRSVAEHVVSLGISEDRIVIDCGANEGSVKLPIVILDEDKKKALLAIWCEKPLSADYDYYDYNVRYFNTLKTIGWNIVRSYAHDWVDNNEAERKAISTAVQKYVIEKN